MNSPASRPDTATPLRPEHFHPYFQPIVSLRSGDVLGFEALLRGLPGSPHPEARELFEWADAAGRRFELEGIGRDVAIKQFVALGLPGKLFLNVSPGFLAGEDGGRIAECVNAAGLSPQRVVLELTENQSTFNSANTHTALLHYRRLGFEIAIDDLGEGFASLRLWSELNPGLVKIDIHFVQGVSQDSLKLEFVKAIQQIAACCNARVIAEGIEDERDLRVLRDLGIRYGQGYFIGRPERVPPIVAPLAVKTALAIKAIPVRPTRSARASTFSTAGKLLQRVAPVDPATVNDVVYERFERDPELVSLPVTIDDKPVGLIFRHTLIDRFARPFRRELYGKRPCEIFMSTSPLIVEVGTPLAELGARVAESDSWQLAEGFILTEQGRYVGVGNGQDLVREITQLQLTAARYANPLTMLPGNVPINEHMERLLAARVGFWACHCDLDNFKPFNDVFGYFKGDDVILQASRALTSVCDVDRDFVGHIGGDDFMLLMQSEDWEGRVREALRLFGESVAASVPDEVRASGGFSSEDRKGTLTRYPLPSISVGAVEVITEFPVGPLEVSSAAADAKTQAKKIAGNALFVERRRLLGAET